MKQLLLTTCLTAVLTLQFFPIQAQTWGDIDYKGEPWINNVSRPNKITRGLQGRHLALWASHGRYFDQNEAAWRWQRPTLFGTNEDLFTQTIVVPYLMPMLENAGAVIYSPRERDWQRHEVIVDNDDHTSLVNYIESGLRQPWTDTGLRGFAHHAGTYRDGENPFEAGTARMAETTGSKRHYSQINYHPNIPEAGSYAVYVSYQTVEGSIDDAHYTVWHKGERTDFRVNQQMGGSTWVYLGTFDFDEGCNQWNRVTLTNQSSHDGVVTADAVRFGGGMGNIERGGSTSGLPRCLEAARYYCQWAGMPYEVYSSKGGQDDYKDDINTRSLSSLLLSGGSCFVPHREGRQVPLELSLAVHSDAGYQADGRSVYGTLTICTTSKDDNQTLAAGTPRTMSKQLATQLLENTTRDLQQQYGKWEQRQLYDRNYSETRIPEVPSSIIETLSHQNFPDMRYGQDPNFRFSLARSIYKTLLKYINKVHEESYAVTPLTPNQLRVEFTNRKGEVRLSWQPVEDPFEETAKPSGYIVYTATGTGGFDNGTAVHGTSYSLKLKPGMLYSFRVAATNKGGQSFPSEVMSALYQPKSQGTVLIVNGFHRLSSPAIVDNDSLQGFDLQADMGISYGRTAGWAGPQEVFNRSSMGVEDSTGLGYGSTSWAGTFFAGNDFNYVQTHAEAIQAAASYSIASCSADAIEQTTRQPYTAVDLILGLECNDGRSLVAYKSFPPDLQAWLANYVRQGGRLLVSGAYVGSDMMAEDERLFLTNVLKCSYGGKSHDTTERINGMGTSFQFYRTPNEQHYAAQHPDVLQPTSGAMATMAYDDGYAAAVAYQGNDYRSFTMGFPFECIKSSQTRAALMKGILNYLIK